MSTPMPPVPPEAHPTTYAVAGYPLELLHWAWRKVSDDDRLRFLTEMLTPTERRALSLGLDDEEDAP